MISYDELCQALDRYNNRLKNEAEMSQLEQVPGEEQGQLDEAGVGLQAAATVSDLAAGADEPINFGSPDAAADGAVQEAIDQGLGLEAGGEQAEAPMDEQQMSQEVAGGDQIIASDLEQERPEETHEIDVDDVAFEDK